MAAAAQHLLSIADEARAFWFIRRRALTNLTRQVLETSRLRLSLVVLLSLIFWSGLFALFLEAFTFLASSITHAAMRDQAIRAVFGVFFASLMVMLLFSTAIILYSSLFRSRESTFLLTLPARAQRVFVHKLQEALLLASWGFLLLGSPMLLAYGLTVQAPWYYYLLLWPFLFGFAAIPGCLGAIACMLVIWKLPTVRLHALAILIGITLVAIAWFGWSVLEGPETDLFTPDWLDRMLARLRFSEHRLLPNWWLSTGLLETARGQWTEGILFLALTISNALLLHITAVALAGRVLRPGYQALLAQGDPKRKLRGAWFDRLVERSVFFLSPPMRLLVVKDLRLFRRDPVQWSQFLIFLGLLGLYFVNVRRFRYDVHHATWVNMVSFLNVAVVGLILSTFTSRFIFPMISLEGRRFWILGLLPIERRTILWSKFLFASLGSIVASSTLVLLSDLMLRVLPLVIAVHLLICLVLCVGLSGIAVGMGAKMPNLREESPSKIAAGFGGTLNLVVSALYIVAVVTLTAIPCHFYVAAWQADLTSHWLTTASSFRWLVAGSISSLLLGTAAVWVPMRLGVRAFDELEF